MRIVFMGTPEFAVPSLKILIDNGFEVVGVITATDKLGGRGGSQLIRSAVKIFAMEHELPVLQPEKLKDPHFLDQLRQLNADLQVVVAFRMLPEAVWSMPRIGTINLHGSLLPKYRGAAPINWAIMQGEKETGVTTFFIRQEIDTGDVILQEKLSIGDNETAGELHERMMILGANVVLKTVKLIQSGNYETFPQDTAQASPAPKLFHENCKIDFHQPVETVHNFIRGLSPHPAAWTILDNKIFKILKARKSDHQPASTPGQIFTNGRTFLHITVVDGSLDILEVQMEGKKRMDIRTFLNGYQLQAIRVN